MVTAKSLRLVPNHPNIRQSHIPEPHCPLLLSNNQLQFRRASQLQSSLPDCQLPHLLQVLLLASHPPQPFQVLRAPNTALPSAVMDMVTLVLRILLCPPSHSKLSPNRPHRLKVHLKAIKIHRPSLNHNHSPGLSPLHRMISPHHTTLVTHNNVRHIIVTTNSSMEFNQVPKVNKMAPRPSDLTVVMVDLKPTEQHLNFPRAQLNKPSHGSQLLAKDKLVVTLPQILWPMLNPKVQAKVRNLNQATHNNHKEVITHTAIHTITANITLTT